MKTLANNISPKNFEPEGKGTDKYYLMAMLAMCVLLFAVAYYDQLVGTIIH